MTLGKNTALEVLNCFENQLSSLDLSGVTALKELGCSNNKLRSLNVSKNKVLEALSCDDNVTIIGKANTKLQ